MSYYSISAHDCTPVPNRDACSVAVRVTRDEVSVGLYHTWISGIADAEITRHHRPSITKLQRRRLAAELLAEAIRERVDGGNLRECWQVEVEVIEIAASAIIARATDASPRFVPDFDPKDILLTFQA